MKRNKNQTKRNPVAAVCSTLGTVFLIVLVAVLAPAAVIPCAFGFQVYEVISGSMLRTSLPAGLVYVQRAEPEQIQEGDVIAFDGGRRRHSLLTGWWRTGL